MGGHGSLHMVANAIAKVKAQWVLAGSKGEFRVALSRTRKGEGTSSPSGFESSSSGKPRISYQTFAPNEIADTTLQPKAFESQPVQETVHGYVVGRDNRTGSAVVSDSSNTYKAPTTGDAELYSGVTVNRSYSTQGGRRLSFTLNLPRAIPIQNGGELTEGPRQDSNLGSCNSSSTNGTRVNEGDPEDPPEEPDDPEDQLPEPPEQPDPGSDPSDQPADPPLTTASGWSCVGGTCVQVSNGMFASQAACEASGCSDRWSCVGGRCIKSPNGSFTSQAACEASGCAVRYDCVGGNCIEAEDGQYASLEDCNASGCSISGAFPLPSDRPFTGGQDPNGLYLVRVSFNPTYEHNGASDTRTGTIPLNSVQGPITGVSFELDSENFGTTNQVCFAGTFVGIVKTPAGNFSKRIDTGSCTNNPPGTRPGRGRLLAVSVVDVTVECVSDNGCPNDSNPPPGPSLLGPVPDIADSGG